MPRLPNRHWCKKCRLAAECVAELVSSWLAPSVKEECSAVVMLWLKPCFEHCLFVALHFQLRAFIHSRPKYTAPVGSLDESLSRPLLEPQKYCQSKPLVECHIRRSIISITGILPLPAFSRCGASGDFSDR